MVCPVHRSVRVARDEIPIRFVSTEMDYFVKIVILTNYEDIYKVTYLVFRIS